jgi:GxxExxY protein
MLKHEDLTDKIIGIFYDVYNELGHGFLESVYQEAMQVALTDVGLHIERQTPIPVYFRGKKVGVFFADVVVNNLVVLELKVARTVERLHEAQLRHYLKATEMEVGLLLNFGEQPQFRRIFLDNEHKKLRGALTEIKPGISRKEIRPDPLNPQNP